MSLRCWIGRHDFRLYRETHAGPAGWTMTVYQCSRCTLRRGEVVA